PAGDRFMPTIVKERTLLDRAMLSIARAHAARATARFHKANANARAVQERLFDELVRKAPAGDFQRSRGFERIRTFDDYRAAVPLQRYAHLSPYIERVRRGEVDALFDRGQRILMFALTSGTTAEPKYIPITPTALAHWREGWNVWGLQALLDHRGTFLRGIVQ